MHEIMKRQKQNGTYSYTARIRLKGYPSMTATFSKKGDAQLWIQENESRMKLGRYIQLPEARKHTVADLIKRYIENELPKRKSDHKKFEMQLKWWSDKIGCYYLSTVTPALITECKEALEREPSGKPKKGKLKRSPATVNRYLAAMSVVFSFACNEYGWLETNPMRKVRKNKEYATKERYLMPDEIERLFKACLEFDLRNENYNYETYLFVLIALSTGARYSEIHNLRWENVDFIHRQFYFLNTKNGENRGVPMTNKVFTELYNFSRIRNIKSDYLWTTKNGEKLIDMRVRFYKVLECADIKECRFHDLRHTVASHIAMNGGSLLDIAQVTGHKTMQMVKRYAHLTKKHTADLLENTTSVMFQQVSRTSTLPFVGQNN